MTKVIHDTVNATLWRRSRFNGGAWSNQSEVSSINSDINTTIEYGPNIPQYKKVIRSHSSATTELSVTGYKVQAPSGLYAYGKRSLIGEPSISQEHEFTGCGAVYPTIPTNLGSVLSGNVEDQVSMGFISKAIKAQRDLQGGVVLGELRDTIHQIRHPLQSLRRGLDGYLSTLRKVRRIPRKFRSPTIGRSGARAVIADTWLEYNLGWRPLMMDIDGAVKGLANYCNYRQPTQFISHAAKNESLVDSFNHNISSGNVTIHRRFEQRSSYEARAYGAVKCSSSVDGSSSLGQTFGLMPRDFLPTIWELIPYSFVVDYFTNIGAIIDAACFNTSSVAWASHGRYSRTVLLGQCDVAYDESDPSRWTGFAFGSGSAPFRSEYFEKVRTAFWRPYVPSLSFKLPGFTTQFINIAALTKNSQATSRLLFGRFGR